LQDTLQETVFFTEQIHLLLILELEDSKTNNMELQDMLLKLMLKEQLFKMQKEMEDTLFQEK